jgi:succinate dehydrogenase / fumarate reductase, cytochrome b subunit
MSALPSSKPARPLSPHLQVYRPQLTSGMSIFHRITGVALAFGLPVFAYWLYTVASGPQAYTALMNCIHGCVVSQICLCGWTFCFFYHFCCGIRHLFWDIGVGLTIKAVYASGYVAILLALIMTACTLLTAYGYVK